MSDIEQIERPASTLEHSDGAPNLSPPSEAHLIATRFLISAMMMGQMHRFHEDAEVIHRSLTLMMGEGDQLRITMALASAMGGDAEPAQRMLDEGVDHWPDGEAAKLSLAMALKLAGDPAWKEAPERVLTSSVDPGLRVFASSLLEDADQPSN